MVGILIPIVAIICTFAVPIAAIIMAHRNRKLQYEERKAMIERGMQPPALEETPWKPPFHRDPAERRERSLYSGMSCLFLGAGLGVAAWLLQNVVEVSFIPKGLVGPLTIGACVLGFIGLGNLAYFFVSAGRVKKAN